MELSFRLPGKDGRMGTTKSAASAPTTPWAPTPTMRMGEQRRHCQRRLAPSPSGSRSRFASFPRCPARFLCARIPSQDGHRPGHGHLFLDTPVRTRTFDVCAELCGAAHAQMRAKAIAIKSIAIGLAGGAEDFADGPAEPPASYVAFITAVRPDNSAKVFCFASQA